MSTINLVLGLLVLAATPGPAALQASTPLQDLCLRLRSEGSSYMAGEPVTVRVEAQNCGSSYVVLYPQFFPQEPGPRPYPWGYLHFEILDSTGHTAAYVGPWKAEKLRLPAPEEFVILRRGYFFGIDVSLSDGPFAYALHNPGIYQVKAILVTSARTWLRSRDGDRPVDFSFDRVLDGVIVSNQVQIELRRR